MLETRDILETINMIDNENLDVCLLYTSDAADD